MDVPRDVVAQVQAVYKGDARAVLDALCSFRNANASIATDRVLRCIDRLRPQLEVDLAVAVSRGWKLSGYAEG